jgi:hypothetical protein
MKCAFTEEEEEELQQQISVFLRQRFPQDSHPFKYIFCKRKQTTKYQICFT